MNKPNTTLFLLIAVVFVAVAVAACAGAEPEDRASQAGVEAAAGPESDTVAGTSSEPIADLGSGPGTDSSNVTANTLVVTPAQSGGQAGSPTSAPASTTEPPPSTTTSAATSTAAAPTSDPTTIAGSAATGETGTDRPWGTPETVRLRFESQVADVPVADFQAEAMAILTDERGWGRAGFTFVADPDATFRVVLAEGPEVDQLCLPLRTFGTVSCQNGPVVALNADRWRGAVGHWTLGTEVYRGYLVNHEVGHLLGQRHPKPRCPVAGRPAGVMEQQTAGLEGCVGNPWPRDWEIDYAGQRPVVYAPLPDWGPDPVPSNGEDGG